MIEGGKPKESFAVPCESCGFCSAIGICNDCDRQQYCKACFSSYHKNPDYPDYANHNLEPLSEEMQLLVQEEIDRKEKERLKHARSWALDLVAGINLRAVVYDGGYDCFNKQPKNLSMGIPKRK